MKWNQDHRFGGAKQWVYQADRENAGVEGREGGNNHLPQERTPDRVYRITNPGLEELQYGFGPSFMIGWIHSSKLPTPENRYTIGNYPRYSNAQWDALNDRYTISIQPAERKQALSDHFVHLQDNLPEMSIIYGVSVQFSSKRLTVPELNPIWTAESWDIK
jgi:hypothetical protein